MSNFWKGRKVLVTGAGGFIGSHLVEQLVGLEAEVTAFLHYHAGGSRGLLDQLPVQDLERIRFVTGDLCDLEAVEDATTGQDIVFHLAAIIAIPFSYMRPAQVMMNNVTSTLNVLQAARRCGVRRLVHTSSSEVYGTARQVPITEEHSLQAQSPYAASKISCDQLALSYHLSYALPVVTLRPFNTYGPRQSARAIIPTIITQALTEKKVFLGATHPTRDFNFVGDTVDAFLRIAEAPGIEGRTYHVGSGREISIGDVADRIIRLTGSEARIIFDATRIRPTASEVNRLICDPTRAKSDIGWEPRVTLDEGLSQTIDWIGRNLSSYRPRDYAV